MEDRKLLVKISVDKSIL